MSFIANPQLVVTDSTLTGNGTEDDPLVVTMPFNIIFSATAPTGVEVNQLWVDIS